MIVYFIVMNIIGLLIMWIDKLKAKKNAWRIAENTLLFICLLGGSVGLWLGMYMFHHKTKHSKFVVGVPMIIIVQVIVYLYNIH